MDNAKLTDEQLMELVKLESGLEIPRAFALHWNEIQSVKKKYISIVAITEQPSIEQSHFGFRPMLPIGFTYPTDAFHHPLYPLAQINFREMPFLEGFPSTGYLQFYISGTADVYGLDFNNQQSQKDFRVLYFEEHEVANFQTDFSFLKFDIKEYKLPSYKPHYLRFESKEEFPGGEDIHYEAFAKRYLEPIAKLYTSIEEDLLFEVSFCLGNIGHRLGGYAYFTQTDPRGYLNSPFKDYILLFQMATDDEIMWGDAGVANFFIHPNDLAKKDFSKVLYNWDCG